MAYTLFSFNVLNTESYNKSHDFVGNPAFSVSSKTSERS